MSCYFVSCVQLVVHSSPAFDNCEAAGLFVVQFFVVYVYCILASACSGFCFNLCVIRAQVKAAALETDGVEIYALSKTKVRESAVRLCYPCTVAWLCLNHEATEIDRIH